MTYVKINGAWYKELQFKEEYTSQEKLYLWYVDLIHKKNLMIRLANNIDLLERMLSKLPKMEDELRTHKTLYVNKVGGFFIKATEDEIEDYDYSETRPFVENEGLCGWLSEDGRFYESVYGAHSDVLNLYGDKIKNAIYFSYGKDVYNELYEMVIKNTDSLSKEQEEWLNANYFALSEKQQEIVKGF